MATTKTTALKLVELLRLMRFGIVGAAAALTHYCSVVALVELCGIAPLVANVGGFFVAFWISYLGHGKWTFGDVATSHGVSFPRFLATAVIGFIFNELLLFAFLRYTNWSYTIDLALAAIIVAISTYILSKLWAFREFAGEPS